jgi:S1-C subfamily serine protease
LELNLKEIKGIQIIRIADKGSLSNTKIKEGDILLAIDGHEINSLSELKELLEQHRPGDKVKLTILQNQKEIEVNLTLKNKRGTTDIITADDFIVTESLGAEFIPIDEQTKARYRVNNGLKIKKLHDGILKQAGISEGYIITAIDKKPVASIKDVERILEDKKGSVLVEGFYMNGIIYYYNIVL